ncbi:MAG: SAM-dependent methyltransferase [Cyanobacteria bacterium QS_8_64_29]|nr:MAG: SAM-dependent methyltransferase [Cyanobacteria bacterium QS_8_64_29]
MVLQPQQRQKIDTADDALFYSAPRLVTHADDGFLEQLTQLYRERLPPDGRILDLMGSWVSHLPEEMAFAHVEGHGMNEAELARNPRLDRYFIQDLNANPELPLADASFDAVLIAASIQYLQYPEAVFAEIRRVLQPGGAAIVSFSNRMFYQKAIAAWRDATDAERIELVKRYFRATGGFTEPEAIARQSQVPAVLQLLGVGGGDPFYAVLAERAA